MVKAVCPYCKEEFQTTNGKYNASVKKGLNLFCCREHSELGRRSNKSTEQKKAEKSAYDLQRRNGNKREEILNKKRQYYLNTYDPKEASVKRKKRMPYHVEYCRRPEYKKKKVEYDQQHRAKQNFGEFWESQILLEKLALLVDNREANQLKGTINKSLKRKRAWLKTKKSNLPQLP